MLNNEMIKEERPKILVVDDEEKNLFAMNALLKHLDVDIDLVDSGRAAVSKVLRNRYALILLDVQMPDLDGFDTASLILGNTTSGDIPIIFVTANYNLKENIYQGYSSGAVEYLTKPIDSKILISKINIFLDIYRNMNSIRLLNNKLNRSNEELSQFAQIASHDLKEPLRGILLNTSAFKELHAENTDEDIISVIDRIEALSGRMKNLVTSLSSYSQVSLIDESIGEIDLNTVVKDIADTTILAYQDKNIKIDVEPDLPTIVGDRTKIGEVFRNLITNAIKYNDKDTIEIKVGKKPDKGLKNCFYIQDNGIGIDPSHHESVFRIFKRLHKENEYSGGTGAGLSIVKKIVELHNGQIWIESELGQGTTFAFTLGKPS